MTRLKQQDPVVETFRQTQELFRYTTSLVESRFTSRGVEPKPPQRLEEVRRVPCLLAQFACAQIRDLDVGVTEAVHLLEAWSEREKQSQLESHLVTVAWELGHEIKSLPEVRDGFAVGRALHGPRPGLIQIGNGLAWYFAPHRMMGKPLDLLAQAIRVEPFDRLHDPGMKGAATIAEEAAVRDLVGQRVLEGVLEVGKELDLVQEVCSLQQGEATSELVRRKVGNRLKHLERHVCPDDRGCLEHGLFLGAQAVNPGGEERLHGDRHLDRVDGLQQTIGPGMPDEHLRLDEGPHAFL